MGKMPVFPRTKNSFDKDLEMTWKYHSSTRPLPANYMSDYSVLGLLVDNLQEALRVLQENDFLVNRETCVDEVEIDHPRHLAEAFRLLEEHQIGCEIADTVDQVYQG